MSERVTTPPSSCGGVLYGGGLVPISGHFFSILNPNHTEFHHGHFSSLN